MADTDTSKKQYTFAQRLWDADAAYRTQAENVKKLTRQTMVMDYLLNGRKYTVAPTAKPMAMVQMFAAFPEITPRISIPPLIQDNDEDEKASSIERFLKGIRRATTYGGIHPDDAVWIHGGEVGRGILYCQFDLDLAKEGLFPFRRKAIDPTTFAFKMSDRGLVCAVTVEERDALELYDELEGVYDKVKDAPDREWEIPEILKRANEDYQQQPVKVMRFWDREREYMWVGNIGGDGECVWKFEGKEGRPHLMEEVPFQIGFVMQMPGDKPEQLGSGIVHYVRGDIINRSKMLDKAYLGFEFFFMPMVMIEGKDGTVRFEQAVPGAVYEQGAKVTQINPVTNGNMLEQLLGHSEKEINDAALSETSMSGDVPDVSGFLFSQANSGPQRRNNRLLDSITDAYKKHYSLILNCVERFANREQAGKFQIESKDAVDRYMRSFTTFSPMKADPNRKVKLTVTLDSATVRGYQIVDVDFKPEPPEDANAKYQRAQLAKTLGESMELIERDVLKLDSPEQARKWREDELLMTDPDWQARQIAIMKRQRLEKDEKLRAEFQQQDLDALPPEIRDLVLQAIQAGMPFDEAMAQADQMVAQTQPPQPDPNAPQVDANGQPIPPQQAQPMQGQPQPQSTGQVDPAMMQQFLAQLPPEVQALFQDPQVMQAFMQLIQQGVPPDQAIQQILQAVQDAQAQQQQQPSGGFVSQAQMGQAPTNPVTNASMQGF